MKVLVTGANGMLGQDLCPILEDVGCFVIETDVETLDITNFEMVETVLTNVHPDIVVHCAAYTNVDSAETDLEKAELINVKGTENIAKVCASVGATLVYISTDYVFDGKKCEPYTPEDKPNPINNYGLTKLKGEEAVKKFCEKYYIARTSWLYGHYGKNFVETMIKQAAAGVQPELARGSEAGRVELKVVDDQIGCPTWTVELANGILKLLSKPYGTYHVCGSGKTSWYGFAEEIFKQYSKSLSEEGMNEKSNLNADLQPCKTEEFPRPAKRPKYSVMDNGKLCRNWQAALKDYMNLREV